MREGYSQGYSQTGTDVRKEATDRAVFDLLHKKVYAREDPQKEHVQDCGKGEEARSL